MSGRKVAFVKITAEGRDKGKEFKITEMPAMQAEKWAIRAFLALARGGIEIPEDIADQGLAGIAVVGFKMFGSMRWEDAEPLLDEMFACIEAVPEPGNHDKVTSLFESSIDEPATNLFLRKQVFGLHVDFSKLVAASKSALAAGMGTTDSPTT
jgi:hypothetical protein